MKSYFEQEVEHLKSFEDFGSNAWFRRLGSYLPSGSVRVKANALYNLLKACGLNPHLITGSQLMQIRNVGKKFASMWDKRMEEIREENKAQAALEQSEQILLLRRIAGSLERIESVLNRAKCPALSPDTMCPEGTE